MPHPRLPQLLSDAKAKGWMPYITTASDEAALLQGCTLDFSAAYRVAHFWHSVLRHSKGEWAGTPIVLTPFQLHKIVIPLYGWKRPDNTRRFRNACIWGPKKIGKSTLCACVGLTGLVLDKEPGAEIYIAANDKKQAAIVAAESINMVRVSPMLRKLLRTFSGSFTIMRDPVSWLRALPCNEETSEGKNGYIVIVDEIHQFKRKAAGMFSSLRYSGIARREPLTFIISTAGEDMTGIGYDEYTYAKSIVIGKHVDPSYLAIVCEAPKDADWTDERVWKQANPHIGYTVRLSEMREACARAKTSDTERRRFLRYRLSRWVNETDPWLDAEKWIASIGDPMPKPTDLVNARWYVGLDLSATTDLTAAARLCRQWAKGSDPRYYLWTHFWLPEDGIEERERRDNIAYRELAKAGWLTLTPGSSVEYEFPLAKVVEWDKEVRINEIAYDKWNALHLVQRMKREYGMSTWEIPQTIQYLSPPSKALDMIIRKHQITNDGNPIMARHVDLVRPYIDPAGNVRPVKGGRNRKVNRIDGIIATINALARALIAKPPPGYASLGLTVLK